MPYKICVSASVSFIKRFVSSLSRKGFTLVEISIVLIIIGLIASGILVGNDLIKAAAARSQITQLQDLQAQINTFRGKYDCIPGDCLNAMTFFGTTDARGNTIANGDGDQIIRAMWANNTSYTSADCLNPSTQGEVTQLFLHLNLATLGAYSTNGNIGHSVVGTAGVEYPTVALGNGTGMIVTCLTDSSYPNFMSAFMRGLNNVIVIGLGATNKNRIGYGIGTHGRGSYGVFGGAPAGNIANIGILASDAQRIDLKIDDGLPLTGAFGVINGETACTYNVATYPASTAVCRLTAGKIIN